MAEKQLTMYQSATSRLRVSRNGPITQLVVDGQGAALVLTADFSPVQKWALSKSAAPNAFQSMQKILDKLEVLAARPGTTFATTRGHPKALTGLMKAMESAGFDINEWNLPEDVKNPPPELGSAEAKKLIEDKKAKEAALDAKNREALERLEAAKRFAESQNKP